uniref:Uncharacterized protein n=1 Tax=Rhizophora mucronata TaxID=61149 RepID=A0A2P2N2E5_RHIMU
MVLVKLRSYGAAILFFLMVEKCDTSKCHAVFVPYFFCPVSKCVHLRFSYGTLRII